MVNSLNFYLKVLWAPKEVEQNVTVELFKKKDEILTKKEMTNVIEDSTVRVKDGSTRVSKVKTEEKETVKPRIKVEMSSTRGIRHRA